MGLLVIVALVGVTLVITARSIRNTLTDRRSLEEHTKALDTLGEVTHQQDWATPLASDLPGARAHVRVVGTEAAAPGPDRAPRRATPSQPPIARPIAPRPHLAPPARRVPPAAPPVPASPPAPPASPPWTVGRESYRPPDEEPRPVPGTEAATAARALGPPDATTRRSGHWRIEPVQAAPVPAPPVPVPVPPEPASGLVLGSVTPTSTSAPAEGSTPSQPWRPAAPAHRRRRALLPAGAVAAAVVVVIAGVGLAAVLGRSDRNRPRSAAIAEPAATVPATAPSTTATTAVPAVLVASDSQGARYNLVSSASVELVPSSPCWVEIRGGSSTGPVVFQGVLRPGDHRPIPATTAVWLRLGNPPGLAIVVNGIPLQPPGRPSSQPYNVTLAPAARG